MTERRFVPPQLLAKALVASNFESCNLDKSRHSELFDALALAVAKALSIQERSYHELPAQARTAEQMEQAITNIRSIAKEYPELVEPIIGSLA